MLMVGMQGMELKRVSEQEFEAHLARMKELTGHNGEAPRSRQQKVNVRELVARM